LERRGDTEDFEGNGDEVKREAKRGVTCDVKHDPG
jgi:hypothetical protein